MDVWVAKLRTCWNTEDVVDVVQVKIISWLMIVEDEVNQINTQDGDLDTEQKYGAPLYQWDTSFGWHGLLQRKKTEEGRWPKIYRDVLNQTIFNKLTHATRRINDVSNKLNDSKAINSNEYEIDFN